tara:strand:- start:20 stop:799 length:780 start_codon:yes stop_codon:yes gene_type:complete
MGNFKFKRHDEGTNYVLLSASITTLIVIFLLLIGVLGYRYNIFSAGYSLLFLTKYALYISILSFALALISIGYTFKLYKKFINFMLSFFILFFNITIIIFFYIQILDLRSNPLINDISTDYNELLKFKVNVEHNLPEEEHYLIQKFGGFKMPNYYLKPLVLSDISKETVFNESLLTLKNMGLEITYTNLEEGIIEALEESFWYKFKDDMIIKIEELVSGNIMVNVRSASRTGKSDFGKNSHRIKSFFILVEKKIGIINK